MNAASSVGGQRASIRGSQIAARSLGLVRRNPLPTTGAVILTTYIVAALAAPVIAPYKPNQMILDSRTGVVERLQSPSWHHFFGTTDIGQDVFSQTVYGARVALIVGLTSALIVTIVGGLVGLVAGYYGGHVDGILMRAADVAYSIPFEPFAILVVGMFHRGLSDIVFAIALVMWRAPGRVVRAQTLSLAQRPFVKAARVAGVSGPRIILRHLAPNVMPFIGLYAAVTVGWAVVAEATISFLGFGDSTHISWGVMLQTAFATGAVNEALWWTIAPGLATAIFVASVFLLARGLEHDATAAPVT